MRINSPEVMSLIKAAFPDYNGKKVSVNPFQGPMSMQSYWSGGYRDYWAVVNMDNLKHAEIPENGTMWNPSIGPLKALPFNAAVIRWTRGPSESVGVYVNPENMNNFYLPNTVELTWEQKVVLSATRSLKSSYGGIKNYRFHQSAQETGINMMQWETAKAQLIAMKYLNNAGALTDSGHNAIGRTDLWQLKQSPVITT